ncbi:MAG: YaaR family protein [Caloramator sp.]|nr:YaaR family protein [Caloramator sp.]
MRVNRAVNTSNIKNSNSITNKNIKSESFSLALDMANKDQTEQRLMDMLKEIENLGKKLISTRSLEDAKIYKAKIQEYLSFVVKNVYTLKKESSPFNYGVRVRIEIINKKLDEITKELIENQKSTIEFADKIEEIKGLLVDVYK